MLSSPIHLIESINTDSELNIQKERIQKFDENLKEVFRSLEKYADALKVLCESENSFLSDLKRFYRDDTMIQGSVKDVSIKYIEDSQKENCVVTSLVNTLKLNAKKIKNDYENFLILFRKQLDDSEAEHPNIVEDLFLWDEQKYDQFDPILLLVNS